MLLKGIALKQAFEERNFDANINHNEVSRIYFSRIPS